MAIGRSLYLCSGSLAASIAAVFATGLAITPLIAATGSSAGATSGSPARRANLLPVTSCADDGSPGTLRAVVSGAASGDTVDLTGVTCSTITLQSGQIVIHVDDLTIAGPGADALMVDANQSSNTGYSHYGRAFYHDGVGTLTIDSLTIANGLINLSDLGTPLTYGGCIFSKNGGVALNDSVVTNCRALTTQGNVWGGGVSAKLLITLNRSTISENQAIASGRYASFSSGGGAFTNGGGMIVNDSLITGNRSEASYSVDNTDHTQASGGGISSYWGGLTISGSIIANNFTGCDTSILYCRGAIGGGIRSVAGFTLIASTVSGNVAEGEGKQVPHGPVCGGGMEIENQLYKNIYISYSTIDSNAVHSGRYRQYFPVYGGAVCLGDGWEGTSTDITNTTISRNVSDYGGGGIWNAGGALTISNSTVSGNDANGIAGAVLVTNFAYTSLSLFNSTVTANVSYGDAGGGGIVDRNMNYETSIESSVVAGNINRANAPTYDADLGVSLGEIAGANNLIVAASGVTLPPDTISADPMLGPLQDNGGPTWTHALLAGSPAIDTGNNLANLDFDQRGSGFSRVAGAATDIGAYEMQTSEPDLIFVNGFDSASAP